MLRLTNLVPPDPGFGRAIAHFGQFLLDLEQATGAHIGSGLLNGAVLGLAREQEVSIPQVGYFLAQVGKVWRVVIHGSSIRLKWRGGLISFKKLEMRGLGG